MNHIKKLSRSEITLLIPIALVSMSGLLGIDIHLPSLPHIMVYMHTNKAHMQQSVSLYLLGLSISLLFYGPLSDKYGRKPIVIFGMTLATLASFATALTTHIHEFLTLRIVQGVGAGVCLGLGRTMIADVLQGERLAVYGGYFTMLLNVSPLLAPAIGGYLQHWFGWQANFIFLGILLAAITLLFCLLTSETNQHKNPQAFSLHGLYEGYKSLLAHPMFMGCAMVTGLSFAAIMTYAATAPFIYQLEFHVSPILFGWLTACLAIAGLFGKLMNARVARKLGSLQTLQLGIWLTVVIALLFGGLVYCHWATIITFLAIMFLTGLTRSFVMVNCTVRALSPFHKKRGTAGAIYGSMQILTGFVASFIVGLFAVSGLTVLSVAYIILAVLSVAAFYLLARRNQ